MKNLRIQAAGVAALSLALLVAVGCGPSAEDQKKLNRMEKSIDAQRAGMSSAQQPGGQPQPGAPK